MVSSNGRTSMPRTAKIWQSNLMFCPILSTPASRAASSGRARPLPAAGRPPARPQRVPCRRRPRDARPARSRLRYRQPRARSRTCRPASDRGSSSRCRPRCGGIARARDPGRQAVERAHGLILGAIDLGAARRRDARLHQRPRRGRRLLLRAPSPFVGRVGEGGGRESTSAAGVTLRSPLVAAAPPRIFSSGSISPASIRKLATRRVSVLNSIA